MGRKCGYSLRRAVSLTNKQETRTGERGHSPVWGRALTPGYVPGYLSAGECPQIIMSSIISVGDQI
ncbi:MAG: hypothetical protein GX325_08480 [Peptococcaceae bacterium]|nr:hypothetical protein [Peptococcaceae bacterium]